MRLHRTISVTPLQMALAAIRTGPLIALVTLAAIFSIATPSFIDSQNVRNIMLQSTPIALLALGQLFVVLVRGVDISVGSNLGLCVVIGALVGRDVDGGLAIVAMVATGAAVGLINGLAIVKARIANPFIVTLGMLSIVLGAALLLSGGEAVEGIPQVLQDMAVGVTLGIPTPFLFTLVIAAIATLFLRRTQWGRWMYAIGGNPDAAGRVGIASDAVQMGCYVVAGVSAALAAMVIGGRFGTGFPDAGTLTELDAISAVVIGGASFMGGRGGVSAALVGALVIGVMRNGLTVSGVDPNWQLVAIGSILVGALGLDRARATLEDRVRAAESRQAERVDSRSVADTQVLQGGRSA